MKDKKPLIIALDYDDKVKARRLLQCLSPEQCRIKVGMHMFTRFGSDWVDEIQQAGFEVFLDLKFHDIPNTVADACAAAASLGVWMLNVHVMGGEAMLLAAQAAVESLCDTPHLIGVTLLTSLDQSALDALGMTQSLQPLVGQYAALAQRCGLAGVVCSASDVALIRQQCGDAFILVTPGLRLEGDKSHDQRRVATPQQAWQAGADYLVLGRAVTQAEDPLAVVQQLQQSLLS